MNDPYARVLLERDRVRLLAKMELEQAVGWDITPLPGPVPEPEPDPVMVERLARHAAQNAEYMRRYRCRLNALKRVA